MINMPLDHKAYLLDYDTFSTNLRPLIEHSLQTASTVQLVVFIESNLSSLRSPDTWRLLTTDWKGEVDIDDVQLCGDIALTKYRVNSNIGLSYEWEELFNVFSTEYKGLATSPILGEILQVAGVSFDPGRLGTYFQSRKAVIANLSLVKQAAKGWGEDLLRPAVLMLQEAIEAEKGLFVTF
jgi:hypothetical protein